MIHPKYKHSREQEKNYGVLYVVLNSKMIFLDAFHNPKTPKCTEVEDEMEETYVRKGGGDDPPVLSLGDYVLIAQSNVPISDSLLLDVEPYHTANCNDAGACWFVDDVKY